MDINLKIEGIKVAKETLDNIIVSLSKKGIDITENPEIAKIGYGLADAVEIANEYAKLARKKVGS